ncbi:MAG: cysteine dioxygenase, partial [Trebonia sp.]
MNADLSVAPEIAQLAESFVPTRCAAALPSTDGRVAGDLADLAATPQRWWDLVRFDARGPVRIPLPDAPGAWLLVLPPG